MRSGAIAAFPGMGSSYFIFTGVKMVYVVVATSLGVQSNQTRVAAGAMYRRWYNPCGRA
jgi:hypothetical protein